MLQEFISLIYPQFCMACNEALEGGEEVICTFCRFEMPKTNLHLTPGNILEQRFWGKVQIAHAFAYLYFLKHGKVQKLIHNLKYKDYQEIGELLGRWYGYDLAEAGFSEKFDIIIPIPLNKNKLRKRGYNQCDTFAKGLSERLSTPLSLDAVKRVTASSTQTKKSRFARWKNVEEIFEIFHPEQIVGKRVLLVDDVVTTGSTLESCAQVLLQGGAKEINVACIAISQ